MLENLLTKEKVSVFLARWTYPWEILIVTSHTVLAIVEAVDI